MTLNIQENQMKDLKMSLNYLIRELKKYDKFVYEHCVRVAKYSKAIGVKLGFHKYECEQLYFGALLHDLGKLNISKKILNKPGRLDYNEYNLIKQHTTMGHKILEETRLLEKHPIILNIVLCHHERMDGSGYPLGIKGHSLPIETRIVAIADSYDAMTSNRNYMTNKSKEEALLELKTCKTMYDQEIVQAFEMTL